MISSILEFKSPIPPSAFFLNNLFDFYSAAELIKCDLLTALLIFDLELFPNSVNCLLLSNAWIYALSESLVDLSGLTYLLGITISSKLSVDWSGWQGFVLQQ